MSDQDAAIAGAIRNCWKLSQHHLCRFHLLKNLKKFIFDSDNKEFYKTAIQLFKQFYWSKTQLMLEENEKKFMDFILKNDNIKKSHSRLSNINRIVELKKQYVDHFTKRLFSCGINSTQRNESLHNGSKFY